MDARQHLPELAERAQLPNRSTDIHDPGVLQRLLDAIDDVLEDAWSTGLMQVESEALRLLGEVAKAETSKRLLALDLLRLHLSIAPLECAVQNRRFDRAWNWAVAPCIRGLSNEHEAEVDLDQPFAAVRAYPFYGHDSLIRWAGSVCFLSWSGSYLTAEATIVAPRIVETLLNDDCSGPRYVESACHVATVLDLDRSTDLPRLVAHLESLADSPQVVGHDRVQLACLLSGGLARHTGTPSVERAEHALKNLSQFFRGHDRLHILVNCVAGDPDQVRARLDQICAAIDTHNDSLLATTKGQLGPVRYARGRMFGIIAPAIRTAIDDDDAVSAAILLARWHGICDELGEPPLICIRTEDSFVWTSREGSARTGSGSAALTHSINKALGLALVDTELRFPVSAPERPGVPNNEAGDLLKHHAESALRPQLGVNLATGIDYEAPGLINLAMERLPLTHLLYRAGGPMLPLIVSHEPPTPERQLLRAQVWIGDLLFADVEGHTIAKLLEAKGVAVEIVDAKQSGVEGFIGAYTDPGLDLLWVASHAEHGHWMPDETALVLAEHEMLGVDELASLVVPPNGQRLLVLNACDSAAAAALGGPSQVGLAGVAAGRHQSVVAHMWPTHFRSAALFGGLLGIGLAEEACFLEAFRFATTERKTSDSIAILREHDAMELADAIGTHEQSFLDAASPVFVV